MTVSYDVAPAVTMYHHILLMLCKEPGSKDHVWDCGADDVKIRQPGYDQSSMCKEGGGFNTYTYAARNQSAGLALRFPPGYGQPVGTEYKYVVMAVHYPQIRNIGDGWTQATSASVVFSMGAKLKSASSLTLVVEGSVPANTIAPVSASFPWLYHFTGHLLFRTIHSHDLALRTLAWIKPSVGLPVKIIDSNPNDQRYIRMSDTVVNPNDQIILKCWFNNSLDTTLIVE